MDCNFVGIDENALLFKCKKFRVKLFAKVESVANQTDRPNMLQLLARFFLEKISFSD